MDLADMFEKFDDEHGKFHRVENKLHARPDICAFLLLDSLCTSADDIVACAEHDQIWLEADTDILARVATEEDIVTLIRCGVMYDRETSSLAMFV